MKYKVLKGEIWKDIEGTDYYMISNFGRVKRNPFTKYHGGYHMDKNYAEALLKPTLGSKGYLKVNIWYKTYWIHRQVAICFIPKVEGKDYINHKNGIKIDNSIDNLEWCTPAENNNHAVKMNLVKKTCLSKATFNTLTGIYYESVRESSRSLGDAGKSLTWKINKNKSPIIFI